MSKPLELLMDENTSEVGKSPARLPFKRSETLKNNFRMWSKSPRKSVTSSVIQFTRHFKIPNQRLLWTDLQNREFSTSKGIQPPLHRPVLTDVDKFERERSAFFQKKERLLESSRYLGKFVAIHNGRIVGYDDNIVKLAKRVYRRFGYSPIYMGKIIAEEQVLDLPSREV